jgi:hypothetical protein
MYDDGAAGLSKTFYGAIVSTLILRFVQKQLAANNVRVVLERRNCPDEQP